MNRRHHPYRSPADARSFEAGWSQRDAYQKLLFGSALAASVIAFENPAQAQDALRTSMAGQTAAEARRIDESNQPYTIKTGDLRVLFSPALGLEYNDNIRLSQGRQQDDFIIRPTLGIDATYPLTQRNLLSLNLTFGYSRYLQHDDLSTWYLQSGSALSFDFYIKDFLFNLHDRFSYMQDSAREGAIANTGSFGNFQNTAGLMGTWDLQDVTLSLGYDHQNYLSTANQYEYTDHASEMLVPRAGLRLNPKLTVGVEGTAAFTRYDQPVLNDNNSYSGGVYADWRPGKYFSLAPRFGYTIYDFRQTSRSVKAVDQNSWYADLTASHRATEAITYGFSAGHEVRLGIESDVINAWYFRPSVSWSVIKNVTFQTGFFYEHGQQNGGRLATLAEDNYDWYGANLGASTALTKNIDLGMNYRLTLRSSNSAAREYTQNVVSLMATYSPR